MCPSTPKIKKADPVAPPPPPPADAPSAPVLNEESLVNGIGSRKSMSQFRIPLATNKSLGKTGINIPSA